MKYIHYCLELGCLRLDYSDAKHSSFRSTCIKSFAPPKERQHFLLEVYWPPITFSTSIWLWWNAVLSPPTPKHDCTDDNTPPCSTQPLHSHPHLLTRYEKPVKLLHHLHTRPTVKTTVLGTVKQKAGGGHDTNEVGLCNLSLPKKEGGKK